MPFMFLQLSLWYLLSIMMFELFAYSTSSCTMKQLNIISEIFPCGIALAISNTAWNLVLTQKFFVTKLFLLALSSWLTDEWNFLFILFDAEWRYIRNSKSHFLCCITFWKRRIHHLRSKQSRPWILHWRASKGIYYPSSFL